jgi:hypothetical protein
MWAYTSRTVWGVSPIQKAILSALLPSSILVMSNVGSCGVGARRWPGRALLRRAGEGLGGEGGGVAGPVGSGVVDMGGARHGPAARLAAQSYGGWLRPRRARRPDDHRFGAGRGP